MGTGATIKTGGARQNKTVSSNISAPSYYSKNQNVYSYGKVLAVIDDQPNNTYIIYTPLRDRVDNSNNKKGKAYPFYPNMTKKPQTGQLVPLIVGPARQQDGMSDSVADQFNQTTYYGDPIDLSASPNGNYISDPNQSEGVNLTNRSNYRTNRIGVDPDEEPFNLGSGWENIAANFIASKEGFTKKGTWDVNAYRAGYGTDRKLVNGQLQVVTKDTTFTKQEAVLTLAYQLKTEYGPKIASQIGGKNWERLNDNQKAALSSLAYNCGVYCYSAREYGKAIKNAIASNNIQLAAQGINNGPKTADGKVLTGLVQRHQDESRLFLS